MKQSDKPYFDFLVRLRDSGTTNMWGAAPFLAEAFDIDERAASKALMRWMKSFDPKGRK